MKFLATIEIEFEASRSEYGTNLDENGCIAAVVNVFENPAMLPSLIKRGEVQTIDIECLE